MEEELICIAKMIDKGEDKDLKHFKIYSRQEAIERIVKAIIEATSTTTPIKTRKVAEYVINALLGE